MNVLSLDLEFNQPSKKIIQVGAAVFNARTGQIIDATEILVNPKENLNIEITKLTGITDQELLQYGVTELEAYQDIKRMSEKWKCFMNPLVWGSGVSNDSLALYKASGSNEENFMGLRVLDVKTIYQSMQIYKNKQYAGGLSQTCDRLGIGFEGRPHTALADAINTFRVWFLLVKRLDNER